MGPSGMAQSEERPTSYHKIARTKLLRGIKTTSPKKPTLSKVGHLDSDKVYIDL